jgi:hypothetical protein
MPDAPSEPVRLAFLISIETYAEMEDGLAKTIKGTHQAALDFRKWLIEEHAVDPVDVAFCAEEEVEGRTAGATADEIQKELFRFVQQGQDQAHELYCYFTGHGFAFQDVDGEHLSDVLLTADYRNSQVSGNQCIQIALLQKWFRSRLGAFDQYYFVDCCRNGIGRGEIEPGILGLSFDRSINTRATVYSLFSTIDGHAAAAGSGFQPILQEALNGRGHAKVWSEPNMEVRFTSVTRYVEGKLQQPVDGSPEGDGSGIIRVIAPAPRYRCEITVDNAGPRDQFEVQIQNSKQQSLKDECFAGPNWIWEAVPDQYSLTLSSPGCLVTPASAPADLYEDCCLQFSKESAGDAQPNGEPHIGRGNGESAPPGGAGFLTVRAPLNGTVGVRSLTWGNKIDLGAGDVAVKLAAGPWEATVFDDRGASVRMEQIDVPPGEEVEVALDAFESSPLRDGLINGIAGYHELGSVDFSESLHPTPDQQLDLWLALIGAARIVRQADDDFSKLGPLPLETFGEVSPGASPFYLLAGLDDADTTLSAGLSPTAPVDRVEIEAHPSFPDLFEFRTDDLGPGPALVSVGLDDNVPLVFPTALLPDRVTLVTVCGTRKGGLRVEQFVLGIGEPADRLDPDEQVPGPPLRTIRELVDIQRRFLGSLPADAVAPAEIVQSPHLQSFEPISAVLATYDLLRQDDVDEARAAVAHLREAFPGLPDTEALAKLAGLEWEPPTSTPLALDGLLSAGMLEDGLPLPAERLDFRGPWTTWYGV